MTFISHFKFRRMSLLLSLLLVFSLSLYAGGEQETEDFNYSGFTRLRIDSSIFDLEFIPQNTTQIVLLEAEIPSGYSLKHGVQGDRVVIQLQRPMFSLPRWGTAGARLRIGVPRSGVDITAKTSTGSIYAENLSGSFDFTTTTGKIELTDSRGTAVSRTTTGSHTIHTFEGSLDSQSTTGSINLVGFSGSITARSTTGFIRGSRIRLRDDSGFQTTTGSIEISLLNDVSQLGFDAQSSTGRIQIDGTSHGRGRVHIPGDGITISTQTTTGYQTFQ
ncbi:MAG: hypothetical protein ACOC0D_04145 [Spirochaeta sp.]